MRASARLIVLVGIVLGHAGIATATTFSFSGQSCVANSYSYINHTSAGTRNSLSGAVGGALVMWCPIVGHEIDDIDVDEEDDLDDDDLDDLDDDEEEDLEEEEL